jgi:hypothetical protein
MSSRGEGRSRRAAILEIARKMPVFLVHENNRKPRLKKNNDLK